MFLYGFDWGIFHMGISWIWSMAMQQELICWRYLPYIRPMFQGYVRVCGFVFIENSRMVCHFSLVATNGICIRLWRGATAKPIRTSYGLSVTRSDKSLWVVESPLNGSDIWGFMWETQCHRSIMTGDGWNLTQIFMVFTWGWWSLALPHYWMIFMIHYPLVMSK